jgi:hypothetical protein
MRKLGTTFASFSQHDSAFCCGIEPHVFIILNDHRHPIVNNAHEFVGRVSKTLRKKFQRINGGTLGWPKEALAVVET